MGHCKKFLQGHNFTDFEIFKIRKKEQSKIVKKTHKKHKNFVKHLR